MVWLNLVAALTAPSPLLATARSASCGSLRSPAAEVDGPLVHDLGFQQG